VLGNVRRLSRDLVLVGCVNCKRGTAWNGPSELFRNGIAAGRTLSEVRRQGDTLSRVEQEVLNGSRVGWSVNRGDNTDADSDGNGFPTNISTVWRAHSHGYCVGSCLSVSRCCNRQNIDISGDKYGQCSLAVLHDAG